MSKIKDHFQKNKSLYIGVGIGVLLGTTVTVVLLSKPGSQIAPKIQQILSYKPIATIEVHIEALGDPGNIIQDVTTGTIYASQGQAARELGLNASRISEQLKGARDQVNGHIFEKLGKAVVTES